MCWFFLNSQGNIRNYLSLSFADFLLLLSAGWWWLNSKSRGKLNPCFKNVYLDLQDVTKKLTLSLTNFPTFWPWKCCYLFTKQTAIGTRLGLPNEILCILAFHKDCKTSRGLEGPFPYHSMPIELKRNWKYILSGHSIRPLQSERESGETVYNFIET